MLLDTSGLLNLLHKSEKHHVEAGLAYSLATSRLTHNYVFAELIALANARRLNRNVALQLVEDMINDSEVMVVWVDSILNAEAFQLLRNRHDKGYSLCDAVSFILMRRQRIHEALTSDHHFEQEGFTRLLRG